MKKWLLIAALLCTGCLSPKILPALRLHTLDPVISVAEFPPTEKTLGVRKLKAARPYETVMAVLGDNQLLHYRILETWAESPQDYVTRAITDALNRTQRFGDVGNAADMARPDLLLTGEVSKFHENRTASPPYAELEVRLALREARSPGGLWDQVLVKRVALAEDTPGAFAKAMEHAIALLAVEAAESIARVPL
jgi:ABC-type uncharacterized transport system auxiliary subunit